MPHGRLARRRIGSDRIGSGCLRVVLPEAAEHRRDLWVGISAQTNKQTNRIHSSTGSGKRAHGSEAPAPTTRMSDKSHAHTRAHGSGSRPHRYLAQRLEERIRVRRPCRGALSHLTEEVVQGVGDRTPAHLAEPTLRGVYAACSTIAQCNAAQHSTAQHDAARHNLPDATRRVATHQPIPRFDWLCETHLTVYSRRERNRARKCVGSHSRAVDRLRLCESSERKPTDRAGAVIP